MKSKDGMTLPKVGDRLMRVMTNTGSRIKNNGLEPCIVIYVNKPKRYYAVQFVNSGITESYKVPLLNDAILLKQFQDDFKHKFGKKPVGVYVYESGALYSSVSECAKAIGVKPCSITNHLHGRTNHVKGYHIYILN